MLSNRKVASRRAATAGIGAALAVILSLAVALPASAQSDSVKDPKHDSYPIDGSMDAVPKSAPDVTAMSITYGKHRTVLVARFTDLKPETQVLFFLASDKHSNSYVASSVKRTARFYLANSAREASAAPLTTDTNLRSCVIAAKRKFGTKGYIKLTLTSSCIDGRVTAAVFAATADGRFGDGASSSHTLKKS